MKDLDLVIVEHGEDIRSINSEFLYSTPSEHENSSSTQSVFF